MAHDYLALRRRLSLPNSHDLLSEARIRLTDLCKREGVSTATGWRWITNGVAGVRLESFSLGGKKRYVTEESWRRFVERVTAAKSGEPIRSRTTRQRQRERRNAHKQNVKAGISLTA